jgi:hypothetical protein
LKYPATCCRQDIQGKTMNKNKSEMDEVLSVIGREGVDARGLKAQLLGLIGGSLAPNNARGFKFMIHYYGLAGEPGMTLEAIGSSVAGGLTRERVRQIIDGALGVLLKAESVAGGPYANAKALFDERLALENQTFLRLSLFVQAQEVTGFGIDPKGLIAFLNDAGIRQVVYRGAHYIYPKHLNRRKAIEFVQAENKKDRRAKTVEKMDKMAKTVTYVPQETRDALLEEAKKRSMPLNRLYEKILTSFMLHPPCKSSEEFEKTQSWRARKGKAEWSQVGIYIDKSVFDQVREAAAAIRPESISNMSYICQAFVCFAKGSLKI